MYKKYYRHFLEANFGIQHYASHSHHYWPDVTREAHLQYWDDSAKYVDDKWDYFFSTKIPQTQNLIAEILNISKPEQISFAPNTHEFVYRLLSCLNFSKKNKIITTDSEFYSFDRQINRLIETGMIEVIKVPTMPFDNFNQRFVEVLKNHSDCSMVFISHVFFNSGMAVKNLNELVSSVTNEDTMFVVDGYHGFMAIPTDLSQIQNRIFYMAGSYKYAQGGEGCCFLYSPPESKLKPVYTGWFAGLSTLGSMKNEVSYPDNGMRFSGSTMDFSALYRLHAVLSLFKKENITVEKIHSHIQHVQKRFIEHLIPLDHFYLSEKNILTIDYSYHGHFLTFALPSNEITKKIHDDLKAHKILTDFRGSRLRFGFGLYHDGIFDLKYLKDQRKI